MIDINILDKQTETNRDRHISPCPGRATGIQNQPHNAADMSDCGVDNGSVPIIWPIVCIIDLTVAERGVINEFLPRGGNWG
jgi:hypothetical protein